MLLVKQLQEDNIALRSALERHTQHLSEQSACMHASLSLFAGCTLPVVVMNRLLCLTSCLSLSLSRSLSLSFRLLYAPHRGSRA
jgi:hypothetical protein